MIKLAIATFSLICPPASAISEAQVSSKGIAPSARFHDSEQPPPDTAILEVSVPADARIAIDGVLQDENRPGTNSGKDRQQFRGLERIEEEIGLSVSRRELHRYQFRGLEKGRLYEHVVEVRLAKSGPVELRKILVRAGGVTRWGPRAPLETLPGVALQTGHSGYTLTVAFRPNGGQLVTGGMDSVAIVWDVETGRSLRTLRGHAGIVRSAVFSPNGRRILTGSSDKTAILWDVESGRRLRSFVGHQGPIIGVAFSGDGRRILTGASTDRTAILWDPFSGKRLQSYTGHNDFIYAVALSRDGRYVLTGSKDRTVRLWEASSGRQIQVFKPHDDSVMSVEFSPDDKYVLSAGGAAFLWDKRSGALVRTFRGPGSCRWAGFNPDGRQVLAGFGEDAVLWETVSGRKIESLKVGSLFSLGFNPSGASFAAATGKGAALWDLKSRRPIRRFHGQTAQTLASFSRDGRFLLVGSGDGTATIWDGLSGRPLRVLAGHSKAVEAVAFSPDSGTVVTGSEDKTAIVWDLATGKKIHVLTTPRLGINSLAFRGDGRHLVAGTFDGARIWDVQSGKEVRWFTAPITLCVSFHPDNRRLVTGGMGLDKHCLHLWDTVTGKQLLSWAEHQALAGQPDGVDEAVMGLALSADGNQVFSASKDGAAVVWNTATGKVIRRFRHTGALSSAALSADGKLAAAGSYDGTAIVWRAETSERLYTLRGCPGERIEKNRAGRGRPW